ncbi:MAG: hypothetical protein KAQ96_09710 [Thermoplasmata archaeon]|nr:hypothetical protein [Thermoplasmata archaeon]
MYPEKRPSGSTVQSFPWTFRVAPTSVVPLTRSWKARVTKPEAGSRSMTPGGVKSMDTERVTTATLPTRSTA